MEAEVEEDEEIAEEVEEEEEEEEEKVEGDAGKVRFLTCLKYKIKHLC